MAQKRRGKKPDSNTLDKYRVNEQIEVPYVRLVGDNVKPKICSTSEAVKIANNKGVDLVEISPNAEPPVCKLIDYSKFKYNLKKKQKELKSKQHKTVIKELRFGPNTDDHDFNFKLQHAIKFLNSGAKVKAYVHFPGRTIIFKERGEVLLLRFANELEEYGKVESLPKVEGRRMSVILSPKK